jgi:hypothetical protein
MIRNLFVVLLLFVLTLPCFAQDRLMARWSFDEGKGKAVKDSISGEVDGIRGNYWYEKGVKGKCLNLDGYTTHVVRAAEKAPRLGDGFTIEAWVAPQAYPWNWAGIVDQEKDQKEGFFFGVSANGNVGLGVAAISDGQWIMCISTEKIEPLKWSHIAATYEESGEMAVYINGNKSGEFSAEEYGWEWMGEMRRPEEVEMWIGRSHRKMYPKGTEREPSRRQLSDMVFDGLIDEVKIHREAMDQEQIRHAYKAVQPKIPQPLRWRRFPTEGADKRQFGAYYTTLKYDETSDKLWRIGEHSDIVVTFEKPVRIVFWHGINYAASYVTENEIWMGDQSLETGSDWGCNEHMSDKQCRYSHVRLIENDDARIVVHWRYALCDIRYVIVNEDPQTGWGDWTDEYFVIYPDAVAVRHQILWSSNFGVALDTSHEVDGVPWHQFQETIMFNQPGTRPEDNVEMGALTVATMEGESYTCMWGEGADFEEDEIVELDVVKKANIQMTNLKSKYKPFIIFEPGVVIAPWVGEDYSFWNHWPVAQLPNDGREALAADRPSHTSFSCGAPIVHKGKGDSNIAVMLYGLTESPIEKLVPLARSWNRPAKLKVIEGGVKNKGYDKFQRAYVLECENGGSKVKLELAGSKDRPIVNPAFVFKGWGERKASVTVSGEKFKEGANYRAGYEKKIDGIDLVLWFEGESEEAETLLISPVD